MTDARPGAARADAGRERTVLVVAVLASFVAFLDGSVVTVALPAITAELGGGLSLQQWVVDAYLITLGALILVAGSLSDLFGRVLVLRAGLLGFGVTSVMCAVAPTGEFLVISRGLQGVAGALLVPSSLAIILSTFRGEAQAKAIGRWTAWTSAAFLLGPLIGGLFVDLLSWRLVFAINVPPIVLTLLLLIRLRQEEQHRNGVRIDVIGAVLAVAGLGAPVFALIEQATFGWSHPLIWGTFSVGVLCLAAFLRRQAVTPFPLMPLSLFRVRNFWVGNLATFVVYGALSLGGFVIAVYLQQSAGYSATAAGAAMLPVTVLNVLLSSWFGGLAGRHGPRFFMGGGPIVGAAGYLLLLRAPDDPSYLTGVLPGVLVFGLGLSMTVAPLTSAILGSIDEARSGIGSAVNNAVSRIAGLIAIALLGVIVGARLDDDGYLRGVLVTAALLAVGGVISAVGISNRTPIGPTPTGPTPTDHTPTDPTPTDHTPSDVS